MGIKWSAVNEPIWRARRAEWIDELRKVKETKRNEKIEANSFQAAKVAREAQNEIQPAMKGYQDGLKLILELEAVILPTALKPEFQNEATRKRWREQLLATKYARSLLPLLAEFHRAVIADACTQSANGIGDTIRTLAEALNIDISIIGS